MTVILLLSTGSISIYILLLAILLICSALISGAEVAYFSLSPNDINALRQAQDRRGDRTLQLLSHPRRLLGTILVANNFINIAIVLISDALVWGIFGEATFDTWGQSLHEMLPTWGLSGATWARTVNFLITVVGVTFMLVLFGEVAPKIYASVHNRSFARFMAPSLHLLSRILSPIVGGLVGMSSQIEKRLGLKLKGQQSQKEDIQDAIELTVTGEDHDESEVDMLKSIIKFNEVTVRQIMKSRPDIIAEDSESTHAEVLQTIKASGFSRLPVCRDSLDDVVGILYAKDFIGFDDTNWQSLIRQEVFYVPESKRINDLLKAFQQKRQHMALVVDEYGGVSGLVTLEDVMEQVIGEITDEFDEGEDVDYVKIDEYNYIFEGKTLIIDACRIMDVDVDLLERYTKEADSVGGMMIEYLGVIPRPYQEVALGVLSLRAERVTKRRIEKVRCTLQNDPAS